MLIMWAWENYCPPLKNVFTFPARKWSCSHVRYKKSCNTHNFCRIATGNQALSLQPKQKLVTCSLSSKDSITALNSLAVTVLTHSYFQPQESQTNCCSPPLTHSFLSMQFLSSSFLPLVCSICRWHTVPLWQSKLFRKDFNWQFKFPSWEPINSL